MGKVQFVTPETVQRLREGGRKKGESEPWASYAEQKNRRKTERHGESQPKESVWYGWPGEKNGGRSRSGRVGTPMGRLEESGQEEK